MRNVFGSLAGLAFVGFGLTAMIHTIIAGRHMSAQVKDPIGEMNWRGALFFGGRDMFTEKGWHHRNLALRFLGFALLAFCAIVVINQPPSNVSLQPTGDLWQLASLALLNSPAAELGRQMATKLMGAMNISDPAFDRVITLRDAYRAMERVVVEHVGRGEMSTIDFLSYVGITETGYSGDPAAFEDFLRAVDQVSEGPSGVQREVCCAD